MRLQKYEYKIVNGFESFKEGQTQSDWDALLAKGPLVVAMFASFEGFGMYRPETFDVIVPPSCGQVNHAVVAVGEVTENGKKNLIVRNSWGENWGYKGYFKIPLENNCSITETSISNKAAKTPT